MSTAYAGGAKTDARDAHVIAETVRHRGDLTLVDVPAALVTELRLLVTHRTDLVTHRTDRVRMINRLRDVLSGYFPALERGVRLLHQSWSSGPPYRLSDAGRDPRPRPFSPGDLAYGPKGPQRRAHRRGARLTTCAQRGGCSTRSITWTTPLVAAMSGVVTSASSTVTKSPDRESARLAP